MFSRFFIDRPIFASVLSVVITMAGALALFAMPIALYPPISPPNVSVQCNYPGASAQVVAETVAAPIEQMVNGVENMMYMSSQSTNDGTYNLTVTFKHGVDLNMAQVMVQNRVSLALPLLPDVIRQTGVTTRKRSPDILLVVALTSPNGRYDQLYLSNYALLQVKDELARLPGVSEVTMLGQRDYSMRAWVDPEKLAARNMTAGDVAAALREQNLQVATGQIGQQPAPEGQVIQVPLSTLGRLSTVEQFGDVVVKTGLDGRYTRLKDVARVELAAKNLDISAQVNGRPCVSMAIFQLPDANALETADIVKAKVVELSKDFPEDVGYEIRYDTTPYIRESIDEVFKTLREAVLLVALVVLLFLQNWRSSLIPLIAVPVAIIGTFAVLLAFGFTLNNLTLFGLVLAIGIVVDDAIVVVEAVEHHIEHGMPPRDATIRAMDEVSGPVIAIGLVLSAVFVPCAFISGIIGQFFRQFALTIATSTIISAFNSLTLSPALAAMLLRPREKGKFEALPRFAFALLGGWLGYTRLAPRTSTGLLQLLVDPSASLSAGPKQGLALAAALGGLLAGWLIAPLVNWLLGVFFGLFNAGFGLSTRVYTRMVRGLLRMSALVLLVYGGLLLLTYSRYQATPHGFIPSQDMGYLLINVQLPDSASMERTIEVMNQIEAIAHQTQGIKHSQAMAGQSFLLSANGSNFGSMFLIFEPYDKRPNPLSERVLRWLARPEMVFLLKTHYDIQRPKIAWDNGPKLTWQDWKSFDLVSGKPPVLFDGPKLEKRLRDWGDDRANGRVKQRGWFEQQIHELVAPVLKRKPTLSSDAIANKLRMRFANEVPDAMITVLGPPPVRGVGRAGGFQMMVELRGEVSPEALKTGKAKAKEGDSEDEGPKAPIQDIALPSLQAQTENLVDLAKQEREITPPTSVFRANVPQIFVDVNRQECLQKGVALKDLFDTMRIYMGSLYVNDFNLFGRTWQVIVQADPKFRTNVETIKGLKVRNATGGMVPLGTLASVKLINGPLVLTRYNMYTAASINGAAAPGVSSGEAIAIMEQLANRELPPSMSYQWTDLAYIELQAGNTAMIIFAFAVVMVFLVLAAQYESWSLPLAIILVVPMCLLSAISGVNIVGEDINIFTQIGFVVLVGLASKNAILIVEFAKMKREAGESRLEATLEACRLRLRPIIMTSMAFILGVVPLMLGAGAGAEMRRTLGTTVFSGMLGVTAFGIFLTPVFFYVIDLASQSALFSSPFMRRLGTVAYWLMSIVLGVLTFGLFFLVVLMRWARRRRTTPISYRPAKPDARPDEPDLSQ